MIKSAQINVRINQAGYDWLERKARETGLRKSEVTRILLKYAMGTMPPSLLTQSPPDPPFTTVEFPSVTTVEFPSARVDPQPIHELTSEPAEDPA